MDNTVEISKTVYIGIRFASFLFQTSRLLQTVELCHECLIPLNNTALEKEVQLLYSDLYFMMTHTYYLLNDLTRGLECARKHLEFV